MNKKFLAMLMALAMIISMVPMAAMAEEVECSASPFGTHSSTWNAGKYVAATETTEGYQTYVCAYCSKVMQTITFPATGKPACKHEHQTTETVAATCGRNGSTKQICKDCGAVVRENVLEATGDHSWESVSTIGGVERFECTVCGQEKTEPIKPECKHDHQTTETVAATCGQNGCTKQICKDCGAVVRENVIEATGDHHWEVEYKCDATETEDGWIRYTCDGCNQSYTDIIPATGKVIETVDTTLDVVPKTGSFFLEWLYALIFG